MGCSCSTSKVERENVAPAGLRPVWRKIEEFKWRRGQETKGSISRAELLRPEELEAAEDDELLSGCESPVMKPTHDHVHSGSLPATEEMKAETVQDEPLVLEEEGKKVDEVAEKKEEEVKNETQKAAEKEAEGRKVGSAMEGDEDLPGSPSFRIYYKGPVHDSNDDKDGEETKKENTQGREENSESSTSSGEESEAKQPMKKKGKRFSALTRAPSAVKSLLNVRNCYNTNSDIDAAVEHKGPVRIPPTPAF